MIYYTKKQEYLRSIQMLQLIQNKYKGKSKDYFLLSFLYDSGYTREDLKNMMDLCKPEKVELNETVFSAENNNIKI